MTGAAIIPRKSIEETLQGKLPQRKICTLAAKGFASYGNQIGTATGIVDEVYHPGYEAKRMEVGAVVAAAPAGNIVRERPANSCDIVVLWAVKPVVTAAVGLPAPPRSITSIPWKPPGRSAKGESGRRT